MTLQDDPYPNLLEHERHPRGARARRLGVPLGIALLAGAAIGGIVLAWLG